MDSGHKCRILVLNRLWQPVNVIGPERAFSLLFQDHAKVINTFDKSFQMLDAAGWMKFSEENPSQRPEDSLHTVKLALRIPRVLLLRYFDKVPAQEVKFCRKAIFERDGYRCQYTGRRLPPSELNIDHVIPRDRGGKTSWENVVTSSIECNSRKANRLPHEAGLHLIRKPSKPKWRPFVTSLLGNEMDEAWKHFLKQDLSSCQRETPSGQD
jgi:5-methylcytosine-specific restriction endonuclease McrA